MSENLNVDPQEIEKFNAIASKWWDLEGEFKPLHRVNPLRLDFILAQRKGLFDATTLDVGCGGGILSESMAKHGAKVTGLDMGKEPLMVAKLHSLETGVEVNYTQSTAEAHAEAHPQHYDVITCMEMLEHVPDPASIVNAIADMIKPGGDVFFSTLNRNLKSYLFAILGAEKIMKMVPEGTHDHSKFIRPSELLAWCDAAGLKAQKMTGIHYNPLTDQFKLGQNVDVNYIIHVKKLP